MKSRVFANCQCSKLKKNPGCPYFESRATKPVNLVALMNPWLPVRKTYTFKCTTKKNIHFCLLSALNYLLRSLVFPCLLQFSFSLFFLVPCISPAQFSFLLRRRLYTSQKTPHLHSVKENTCILYC